MTRKIAAFAKAARPAQRSRKPTEARRAKNAVSAHADAAPKNPAETPALAGVGPPPPGHGKRGEDGHLGYLLRQAQAASRLRMERALADLGVTPPQFVVLTMLKAYPGLSGAELARVALLTPQTVGVIIRNLERAGSIRKTAHPVHGRVLMWSLTRSGTALLGKCRRHALALERRLGAGLSERAQLTVRRWLARVAMELSEDGLPPRNRLLPEPARQR
jgi:DNA-binding MarR family transcriptional regulator